MIDNNRYLIYNGVAKTRRTARQIRRQARDHASASAGGRKSQSKFDSNCETGSTCARDLPSDTRRHPKQVSLGKLSIIEEERRSVWKQTTTVRRSPRIPREASVRAPPRGRLVTVLLLRGRCSMHLCVRPRRDYRKHSASELLDLRSFDVTSIILYYLSA